MKLINKALFIEFVQKNLNFIFTQTGTNLLPTTILTENTEMSIYG